MKNIVLFNGQCTLVDDDDHDRLSMYRWGLSNGYPARSVGNGKYEYMHRMIMNAPSDKYVDHINGNRLDNRRKNLRLATNRENCRNTKQQVGYKGVQRVRFTKRGRAGVKFTKRPTYSAMIKVDYATVYLGSFATEEEAGHAYNCAAVKYFGHFARLNEINHGIFDGIGDSLFIR